MDDELPFAKEVQRGIALLDEKGPKGWRKRIDKGILNVEDCEVCPLGQVYDWYGDGLDELGLSAGEAYLYGFDIRTYDGPLLNRTWRTLLG